MARNENRNPFRSRRAAHGTDGLGIANRLCDFAVTFGFTGGNFPQRVPDAFLKFCSRQIQRWKFFRFRSERPWDCQSPVRFRRNFWFYRWKFSAARSRRFSEILFPPNPAVEVF